MKLHRIVAYDGKAPIGWMHWCPGCEEPHAIYVEQPNPSTGARWSFNGSTEAPDLNPSILVFSEVNGARRTHCHYFLHAGQLQFCSDSPHKLAGQTVALPEFPPSYLEPPTMTRAKSTKTKTDPNLLQRSHVVAAGATVHFVPPFDTASPRRDVVAEVTKVNSDRTVHLVAHDGNDTPHENVPVVAPGEPQPANGPFVVGELKGAAPKKPRSRPAPALKRKLPPTKKKAKK